jgi:hypothetical protein
MPLWSERDGAVPQRDGTQAKVTSAQSDTGERKGGGKKKKKCKKPRKGFVTKESEMKERLFVLQKRESTQECCFFLIYVGHWETGSISLVF